MQGEEIVRKLVHAIAIAADCGEPERVSLYDEEGVEGWRWTASDGYEWTEMGDWSKQPMHPVLEDAVDAANEWLESPLLESSGPEPVTETPVEEPWQTGRPPNEELVEVMLDGEIIRVRAFYGRDGWRPHWRSEDETTSWSVESFSAWRRIASSTQ